jgi:hypothetical protein
MPAPLTAAGSARISLRFLSPHRFAALVEAFGTAAQEKGALWVRAYLLRIWCTNLAITQEEMRQVHLGKRLDESMIYSERTYKLDAQATVSVLKEVIQRQLNAGQLQQHMELIRRDSAVQWLPAKLGICFERRCKSTKLIRSSRPTTLRTR